MKISAQRLRNLTTLRLHTSMDDIVADLEAITRTPGIFTHQLPRVMDAVMPWLKAQTLDPRFWGDTFDPSHDGEVDLPEPTDDELANIMRRFVCAPMPFGANR